MKMNVKRLMSAATVTALCLSLLGGCSTPGSQQQEPGGETTGAVVNENGEKTLRVYMTTEPPSLDPQKSNAMAGATVLYHITDGLMRNNCGTVDPAVATDYELSEDGLTYTFHLREDALWSDGEPVTAADYVYGFRRLMDPATASPMSYIGELLKNGKAVAAGEVPVEELGVSAPDDYTVEVTLEYPAPYFPSMLSGSFFAPVRQDIVEQYGEDFAATPEKNVYNGPFTLTEWQQNGRLVLTKNQNYWDKDNVKLDRVEIYILTDPNTPLGMYETGDLDFVDVPVAAADQYRDQAKFYANGSMDYLQINLDSGNEFLANKNFRKALSYGISREDLSTMARAGVSQPTGRLVLPEMPGYESTWSEDYPYDPYPTAGDAATAQEYLQKAMEELGVSDPSEIQFTLNYAEAESTRKIVEVIQAQWQQNLGVTVTIEPVPYAVLYDNQGTGNFEMMYTGWTPDYDDPVSYLELFISTGGYNHSNYNNPDYDAAMTNAQNAQDTKERCDYLFEAEQIVCDDLPIIVLDADQKMSLWDENKVINFQPYHIGTLWNLIYTDIAS